LHALTHEGVAQQGQRLPACGSTTLTTALKPRRKQGANTSHHHRKENMTNEIWVNPPTAESVARQKKGRKLAPVAALLILANIVLFASCSSGGDELCLSCDNAAGWSSTGA
jgi:adenylylsulfate kinase-like enzyme